MLITVCQVAVFAALILNRALMFTIPIFDAPLKNFPVRNLLCGAFSDLFAATILISIFGTMRLIPPKGGWRKVAEASIVIVTIGTLGGLAAHLRYVEYFGMAVRMFHLGTMNTGEMWYVGLFMVLESWRSQGLIAGSLLSAAAVSLWRQKNQPWPRSLHPYWKRALLAVAFAGAFNSLNINLRMKPGVHGELRHNPISALYFTNKDHAKYTSADLPSGQSLLNIRSAPGIAAPERVWSPQEPEENGITPMWQLKVPSAPVNGNSPAKDLRLLLREKLRQYIEAGTKTRGPWNVVLLLQESLRAHELEAFGNSEPPYDKLTPHMSRIFREGVRFTRTINTGIGTRHGQIATQCSLPAFEDFPMMTVAPTARAVCLPDVFKAQGYATLFGYGSTNQFDSQFEFYSAHGVDTIFGSEVFDKTAARARWGISDSALIEKTFEYLNSYKDAGKPFFATILTLSNHGPQKLPDDAPPFIDRTMNEREQLLAYVDWVFGAFYERISRDFSHTIVVTIADHGIWYESISGESADMWKILERVNRIPFAINIPGLPAELAGEVSSITSNMDVAPTLLALLDAGNVGNQFFGVDAFSRTTPILINIYERTHTLSQGKESAGTESFSTPVEMERSIADAIGVLPRLNLLAPAKR